MHVKSLVCGPPEKVEVEEPPVKSKPRVEGEVSASVKTQNDSHVYVHFYFDSALDGMLIRIWKTTFLIDRQSGSRSALVHAENISYAPQWTIVPTKTTFSFLLIFSALPKACTVFDLLEDIPQSGGFFVPGIVRNPLDVYHVDI